MTTTAESLISLIICPRPVRPRAESDAAAEAESCQVQVGRILQPQAVLPEEDEECGIVAA